MIIQNSEQYKKDKTEEVVFQDNFHILFGDGEMHLKEGNFYIGKMTKREGYSLYKALRNVIYKKKG